ncbi:sulfotransferase [Leptolyngbya sp. PCC 6406]|uniref:sulfotransferase n=1 Tax=Leptolyngbya sp. PCC 6406 TaxID=1173264 RepID=UPI0002AC81BA|nr:sulfotransferase [Leptolyngbya sp. PCC 6406]
MPKTISQKSEAKKVAFIVSSGHSGSSLLALILGSNPACFSAGELVGLPNRYRKSKPLDCVNMTSDFWENTFGIEGIERLAAVLGDTRINPYIPLRFEKKLRSFIGKNEIFNPYSYMFSKLSMKDVFVDSSKSRHWVQKRLDAQEFKSGKLQGKLIHLVRDGRAVINSFLRKYGHWGMEKAAHDWVRKTQDRLKFFDSFDSGSKIQIRYEELASDPHRVTQELCEFLDMSFMPSMLEYWKHDHHDISGNDGTYTLIRRYRGDISTGGSKADQDSYYAKTDIAIKLDLRWQRELSAEQLSVFEEIAGEVNQPFAWND